MPSKTSQTFFKSSVPYGFHLIPHGVGVKNGNFDSKSIWAFLKENARYIKSYETIFLSIKL
jgi:hypothetical protein